MKYSGLRIDLVALTRLEVADQHFNIEEGCSFSNGRRMAPYSAGNYCAASDTAGGLDAIPPRTPAVQMLQANVPTPQNDVSDWFGASLSCGVPTAMAMRGPTADAPLPPAPPTGPPGAAAAGA